jgi:hypothetical protein
MKNSKNNSKRHQKYYKMKGCSKKNRKTCLGGGNSNVNLAYPSNNIKFDSNPFLAYTGKGGENNENGMNRAYPSTGPNPSGFNFLNPQGPQSGGACGSCGSLFQYGGSQNGGHCSACSAVMRGGSSNHRSECKCSSCKMGGGGPLVGNPWTPNVGGWSGVDGVNGNRNFFSQNTYSPNDVSRQMISTGANPPYSVGGKKTRSKKHKNKNTKGYRGGSLTNLLSQDFVNLGRQFTFGAGSAYNAINGYASPVNPMPWKDQLPNTPSLASLKSVSI